MINAATICDLLDSLPFDIRLEILLAQLVKDDTSMDNIVVASNSLFSRTYHRDIEKISDVEYDLSRKKKLLFLVNRDGIYDNIPEDLFHQPPDLGQNASVEDVVKEMRTQDKIGQDTRQFFLPIEQELYRLRTKLALEEEDFLSHDGLLADLWDLPAIFDELQKDRLSLLMPVIHKITGDRAVIGHVIHFITGYEVAVSGAPSRRHTLSESPVLGLAQLGIDSTLAGDIDDPLPAVKLTITLEDNDLLAEFLPGGPKHALFQYLADLLIPLEEEIIFEWTMPEEMGFILGQDESNKARLNYTTVI